MKIICSAFIMICQLTLAYGQESKLGSWYCYFGNQKINNSWNWYNEVQYDNYNFSGDLEQFMLQTGVGYNLTPNNNNVLLGYSFTHSESYVKNTDNKTHTSEHKIYQQFLTRHMIGGMIVRNRYRVEERFQSNNVFKMRYRYFLSVNLPLNKKIIEHNTFYLSGSNEIFMNGKAPAFDRDRIFGGLGYGINKNLRIETGLMDQLYKDHSRPQLQIMFFNNTPFKKHHRSASEDI
jgi:hypothetical protein